MNDSMQNPTLFNTETEQALLGSILINPAAYDEVAEIIQADDFSIHRHRWIWQAMVNLLEHGRDLDLLTLCNELEKHDRLTEVGSMVYLTGLLNATPTSLHAVEYARIVREAAQRRLLLQLAGELASHAHHASDLQQVIDHAQRAVLELNQRELTHQFLNVHQVVAGVHQETTVLAEEGRMTGIPTGCPELDHLTNGLQDADLIVIAGRPGMGKTAFALDLARHVALVQDLSVVLFSLEMSTRQLGQRLLSQQAGVDLQQLRAGRLTKEEWARLNQAVDDFERAPLILDDTPCLTPSQLRARCRMLYRSNNIDLVIIDYLQLMSGGERFESRVQEVGHITRQLKLLARELNVPIVATAQLSRAVEQRQDKRPLLADLRESGAIEQDADLVVFLYRPAVYMDSTDPQRAELILAKQRSGPTGVIDLHFQDTLASFSASTQNS
jgi:replicative DNA helicase